MAFDRDTFHREAIQTPSHEDVAEMRALLVETLESEGHDLRVDEAGNVLATRGTSGDTGSHLVLNTHIDTVPPHVPFERDGDVVRGRGACDAKGPLAALLDAFCSAPIGDGRVTLAITPDEETAQYGGAHLGETFSADGYIVGEPTGLDVCIAARGVFGGHVTIYGENAHASAPSDGRNAIEGVVPLLEALEKYDEQRSQARHGLLGEPTLTPTRIEGGGPLNQIPAECTIGFDRRTVPPETIEGFVADLEAYLVAALPDEFEFDVRAAYPESPDPDAFATDPDAPLVQTLADESGGVVQAFEAATDASYFADDAPTVVFGPGALADEDGPVAHSDREYVSRTEVGAAAEAVQKTIGTFLT